MALAKSVTSVAPSYVHVNARIMFASCCNLKNLIHTFFVFFKNLLLQSFFRDTMNAPFITHRV